MAFTDLGSLGATGSTANNQTTLDLVTTAAIAAGNFVVVVVAADNIANGGDDNACSGVTLGVGGQALTKGIQIANALAAQAGASCSIWYGISTSGLASGGTIRATFGSASLVDASGLTARKFSVANPVVIEGTPGTLVNNTGADPGSLNVTTANIECLRVRGIASQVGNNTNLTVTASWTAWANGNSATTGTTGEMCARAEHRIVTGTSAASDPTYVSAIYASAYVAFKEVPPAASDGDADGLGAATATGTGIAAANASTAIGTATATATGATTGSFGAAVGTGTADAVGVQIEEIVGTTFGNLKHWFNGVPIPILYSGATTGPLKYWFNGVPVQALLPDFGAVVLSGTGAATSVGAAAGVGDTAGVITSGAGAASGIGTGTATGIALKPATATAASTGVATATGAGFGVAQGAAAGTGTAAGSGRAVLPVAGTATGTGVASAAGAETAATAGTAAGIGAATGTAQLPIVGVTADSTVWTADTHCVTADGRIICIPAYVAEAASAVDGFDADVVAGGAVIDADLVEAADAIEALDAVADVAAAVDEPAAALDEIDAAVGAQILSGTVDEAVTALDALDADVISVEVPIAVGGGAYYPRRRPLPVYGVGYGILPPLWGEAHGVVGVAGQSAAQVLVRATAVGVCGQAGNAAVVLKALSVTGKGAVGTRGAGAGLIVKFSGSAAGRHDDDEAAVITFLLAA